MRLTNLVNYQLNSITDRIVGTSNSASHQKIIQSAIGRFGAKVSVKVDPEIRPGSIVVAGEYSPWKVRQNIDIILVCNSRRTKMDPSTWESTRDQLSDALQHELIHRDQCSYMTHPSLDYSEQGVKNLAGHRCKNPKKQANREYLGAVDEIEAYAHDIMLELKRNCPRTDPLKLLRNFTKVSSTKSASLADYRKTFDRDNQHPAMKRLIKKAVMWIENENQRQAHEAFEPLGSSCRGT